MDAEKIRNTTFRRVVWGYSPSEVQAFLQQVAASLDRRDATGQTPDGASGAVATPHPVEAVVALAGLGESGGTSRLETGARGRALRGAQGAAASRTHPLETVAQEQPQGANWQRGVCQDATQAEAASLGFDEDGASQEQAAVEGSPQGADALLPPAHVSQVALPGAGELADLARRLGIRSDAPQRTDRSEQ